jgi:hypothetical protein
MTPKAQCRDICFHVQRSSLIRSFGDRWRPGVCNSPSEQTVIWLLHVGTGARAEKYAPGVAFTRGGAQVTRNERFA